MSDIPARVSNVLCFVLNVDPERVTPEAKIIGDLDADSLDTIEVVMTLEDELGIEITDEIAESIRPEVEAINSVTQLTIQTSDAP